MVDEPVGAHHGGDVAAPVFSEIANQILPYLDVKPDEEPDAKASAGQLASNRAPALPSANQLAALASKEPEIAADETAGLPEVESQRMAGGEINEVVYAASRARALLMPDLRGRSVRDVARICDRLGLELEARGEGRALRQSPAVGASVESGQTVRIEFGRSD
jgi:hypothetical protein